MHTIRIQDFRIIYIHILHMCAWQTYQYQSQGFTVYASHIKSSGLTSLYTAWSPVPVVQNEKRNNGNKRTEIMI